MPQLKNIAIAGAGGIVGPFVLKALLKHNFNVTVLSRPTSTTKYDPAVKVARTDYTPASLKLALQGQDGVVVTLGREGIASQTYIIDAAIEAGVKHFIPSEFGVSMDANYDPVYRASLKPKMDIRDYLVKKAGDAPGFSWTAVANGPFIDWALVNMPPLGFNLRAHTASIIDSGDKIFTATTLATIGEAVAHIFLHPDETANRVAQIAEIRTSSNEIVKMLEALTGESWQVEHQKGRDAYEEGLAKMKAGNPIGFANVLRQELFSDSTGSCVLDGKDNELLGVQQIPIDVVLKECLAQIARQG